MPKAIKLSDVSQSTRLEKCHLFIFNRMKMDFIWVWYSCSAYRCMNIPASQSEFSRFDENVDKISQKLPSLQRDVLYIIYTISFSSDFYTNTDTPYSICCYWIHPRNFFEREKKETWRCLFAGQAQIHCWNFVETEIGLAQEHLAVCVYWR